MQNLISQPTGENSFNSHLWWRQVSHTQTNGNVRYATAASLNVASFSVAPV